MREARNALNQSVGTTEARYRLQPMPMPMLVGHEPERDATKATYPTTRLPDY